MQKLPQIIPQQAGSSPVTVSGPRTPSSRPASKPTSNSTVTAAKLATDRLLNLLPPLDVNDPMAFITAITAIFGSFPPAVVDKAVPTIATRSDRPTLKLIKSVCDELYEPILRGLEREERRRERAARRLLPPPKRTPEQQARIDAMVAETRAALGVANAPEKKEYSAPVLKQGDGMHGERVAADLAARKARREARGESDGGLD
jgi:hypothetical protein